MFCKGVITVIGHGVKDGKGEVRIEQWGDNAKGVR